MMKMIQILSRLLLLILIGSVWSRAVPAQHKAGDIAIIRFNTDSPDGFSFVALSNIPSGDSLFFTDEGWDATAGSTGWRVSSEEHLKYISPGLNAGDIVHIDEESTDSFTLSGAGGTITLARGSGFSLFGGDQLLVYSGAAGLRPDNPVFIAALHADDGQSTVTGSNDAESGFTRKGEVNGLTAFSTLPASLVPGAHAIAVFPAAGTEQDNMRYDCTVTSGSRAEILLAVSDKDNWVSDNNSAYGTDTVCSSFSVNSSTSTIIHGDAGWRMLSVPVSGASVSDLSDDSPVQGVSGGALSGSEANIYINKGSDGTGTNGWTVPANTGSEWGKGYGFIWYFFDNTSGGSNELPVALDASGTEPASDVSLSLTDTYTLAGNPYQSPLKLDGITGDGSGGIGNGLVSPVSLWSDSAGSWVTRNFGESHIIDTWTGFFVQRSSENPAGTLTIPRSARADTSVSISHSKGSDISYRKIPLHLEGGTWADRSVQLYFHRDAGADDDGYDGRKLKPLNGAPYLGLLSSEDNTRLLVQDARPYFLSTVQEYNLRIFTSGYENELKLSWPDWVNIPDSWEVLLFDPLNPDDRGTDMRIAGSCRITIENDTELKDLNIRILPNSAVAAVSEGRESGNRAMLLQNYPNPFNHSTVIRFYLPAAEEIKLDIYTLSGRRIVRLAEGFRRQGKHRFSWNAAGYSSGIYLLKLQGRKFTEIKKIVLLK